MCFQTLIANPSAVGGVNQNAGRAKQHVSGLHKNTSALVCCVPYTVMDFSYSSSVFSFWTKSVIVFSVLVAAKASSENAKTVEFNVKPGGVVHSFTEKIVSKPVYKEIIEAVVLS